MTIQPSSTPSARKSGWARLGWLVPGVWLAFLYFPITEMLESGASTGVKVLGIGCVVAFAVAYLVGFHLHMSGWQPASGSSAWRWGQLGLLCLLIVALWLILGSLALSLAPYVVASTSYLFRLRTAALLGAVLIATLSLAAWLSHNPSLWYIVVVTAGVFGFSMVMSALISAGEREEAARRDLALISERERVARDVHDGLGHTLTVVALKAELAQRILATDPDRARAELADLRRLIRDALAEVRITVGGLRASDLATQAEALSMTLSGAGLKVILDGEPADVEADPDLEPALGWVLREAVTNVLRHANAGRCTLAFSTRSISVTDDGVGIGDAAPSHGLAGMGERLGPLGAKLQILAVEPSGTRVEVTW